MVVECVLQCCARRALPASSTVNGMPTCDLTPDLQFRIGLLMIRVSGTKTGLPEETMRLVIPRSGFSCLEV